MSWETLQAKHPWPLSQPSVSPYIHGWAIHEAAWHTVLDGLADPLLLEVGAWTGKTSEWLMRTFPSLRLIAVDRWSVDPDEYSGEDALGVTYLKTWWGRWLAEGLVTTDDSPVDLYRANLWPYRDRVAVIQAESVTGMEAAAKHCRPSVAYIDADHHYGAVCADNVAALRLFPESVICGDDYTEGNGVQRAVHEIAEAAGLTVTRLGNQRFWLYG